MGQGVGVQRAVHGSGRLYVKAFRDGEWIKVNYSARYLGGELARGEARKATAEELGALGKLYGRCLCCGRTLTDEESIARGIGPVCASKL